MNRLRSTTLANGVTVYTYNNGAATLALGIAIRAGLRVEGENESGMAHFLEHMLFKGTPTRTALQLMQEPERRGTEINAYTDMHYTFYYQHGLPEQLAVNLELLTDMVVNATLPENEFLCEREVVLQEIAESEDSPVDLCDTLLMSTVFAGQSGERHILGTTESISATTRQMMLDFKQRLYTGNNMVVLAVGDVAHADVVALAEQHLAQVPAGTAVNPTRLDFHKAVAVMTREEQKQVHVRVAIPIADGALKDSFYMSMLSDVLSGGLSSPMFQEIREKLGLAYTIYTYTQLHTDMGLFTVTCSTEPDKLPTLLKALAQMLGRTDWIVSDELDRSRAQLKFAAKRRISGSRSLMELLVSLLMSEGRMLSPEQYLDRIDATTIADMRRVARIYLKPNLATVVAVGPVTEDALRTMWQEALASI